MLRIPIRAHYFTQSMSADSGFPPIAMPDARVLVLGSMPGRRSLEQHQYYGHPQNAFWRIMAHFTGVAANEDYAVRVKGCENTQIAVWDVIDRCVRPGSLDADIESSSIYVNDFEQFFANHKHIQAVFFNGAKAATEYKRRVIPNLSLEHTKLPNSQLLSTSPANAQYSFEKKLSNWSVIAEFLH